MLEAITFSVQNISYPGDPTFTQLLGINNAGTIAGTHNGALPQGFTLTLPNTFTSQNFPGAVATRVTAVNNNGSTAGIYVDATGTTQGFTKIGGTFTTVDQPGTKFNQALGILIDRTARFPKLALNGPRAISGVWSL